MAFNGLNPGLFKRGREESGHSPFYCKSYSRLQTFAGNIKQFFATTLHRKPQIIVQANLFFWGLGLQFHYTDHITKPVRPNVTEGC
jgi:hypothetical protein